jgi:hypothetical protein
MYHKAFDNGNWQGDWKGMTGKFKSVPPRSRGAKAVSMYLVSERTMEFGSNTTVTISSLEVGDLLAESSRHAKRFGTVWDFVDF